MPTVVSGEEPVGLLPTTLSSAIAAAFAARIATEAARDTTLATIDTAVTDAVEAALAVIAQASLDATRVVYPSALSAAAAPTIASTVTLLVTSGYWSPGDGGGATYRYMSAPPAGAEVITIGDRHYVLAEERPDIRQFGAVTSTSPGDVDITDAVDRAAAHCGTSRVLRIPAGSFYVASPSAFGDLTLECDPFAEIRAWGNPPTTVTLVPGVWWFVMAGQQFRSWISGRWKPSLLEKDMFMPSRRSPRAVARAIDCSTIAPTKILVDAGDTFSTAGAFGAADYAAFSALDADGHWHLVPVPIRHGERVSWAPETPTGFGDAVFGALIKCTGGYVVVQVDQAGTVTTKTKVIGSPITSATVNYAGRTDPWSLGHRAVFGVEATGPKVAAVLINGCLVQSGIPLPGIIEAVAPAVTKPTPGGINVVFRGMIVTGGEAPAARTVSIGVIGDSRSAEDLWINWPSYLRQALDGSRGIRVRPIVDQAVSGYNVHQMLVKAQTEGWPTTDLTIFDLATNDTQQQTPMASFEADARALITGSPSPIRVIVVPSHYLQPDGSGQPTVYAEAGGPYRATMMRIAADLGLPLVDQASVVGPIVPALSGTVPDMYRDEIHWTSRAQQIIGYALAEIAADLLSPVAGAATGYIVLPTEIFGGADLVPVSPVPTVRIGNVDDKAHADFSGGLTIDNPAVGKEIMTLPPIFCSAYDRRFSVACNNSTFEVVLVFTAATRKVTLAGSFSGSSITIWLDGMGWPTL